jgi:hypothetical protein
MTKYFCINRKFLKTRKQHYRVDRREIAFLKFILEAYDGIVTIKTEDAMRGIITLHIAPGCEKQLAGILQDLKKDILIEQKQMS